MDFYDAVAKGQEQIMIDEQQKIIARDLMSGSKRTPEHRLSLNSKIRATVKRLLRRYGYKPAVCETMVVVNMGQEESLYRDWPEAA